MAVGHWRFAASGPGSLFKINSTKKSIKYLETLAENLVASAWSKVDCPAGGIPRISIIQKMYLVFAQSIKPGVPIIMEIHFYMKNIEGWFYWIMNNVQYFTRTKTKLVSITVLFYILQLFTYIFIKSANNSGAHSM